jgi:hypothetical protein
VVGHGACKAKWIEAASKNAKAAKTANLFTRHPVALFPFFRSFFQKKGFALTARISNQRIMPHLSSNAILGFSRNAKRGDRSPCLLH